MKKMDYYTRRYAGGAILFLSLAILSIVAKDHYYTHHSLRIIFRTTGYLFVVCSFLL